jgi:hypothetical protein
MKDEMSDDRINRKCRTKHDELILIRKNHVEGKGQRVGMPMSSHEISAHIDGFEQGAKWMRSLAEKDNNILRSMYKGAIDDLEWERNNKKQLHEDELIGFAEWIIEVTSDRGEYWEFHTPEGEKITTAQLLIKYRESCK